MSEEYSISSDPELSKAIQDKIGNKLRDMFNCVVEQPIPDRFQKLLDQLDSHDER